MLQFARSLAVINLLGGLTLLLFPGFARPLIVARAEYARLSDNALRILGFWQLVMGLALVWSASPRADLARMGEPISSGQRWVAESFAPGAPQAPTLPR